jgi:F-type H+-transporting ATPase subunit gamma
LPGFGDRPALADILPLARLIADEYEACTYNQVDVVFTRFVSTLVQRADMVQLLPIKPSLDTPRHPRLAVHLRAGPGPRSSTSSCRATSHAAVPGGAGSTASFFSSQMVAMKNATENADELIEDLTLSYNKARQANITRELIEIASGAQAR